jgi:hypothetical protein
MKLNANMILGFSLAFAVFGILFMFYGYEDTWRLWYIRPMSPHFGDLRVITGGAESYKQGYDPLVNNPGDPWQRRMNYPRIWQALYIMGVNESHTTYLGIAFILLFFVGVYLYLPRISNVIVAFLFLAILSPAVLFGIERANIDLVIFFLLSLSIVLVCKHPVLSMISILFAFSLKLFPVFGLVVLLRRNQATVCKLAIASLVFISFYIVFTFHDLALISEGTPRSTYLSYGIDVFWMVVTRRYTHIIKMCGRILSYFGALLVFLCALPAMWRHDTITNKENERNIDSFRMGSAIYIGTFMLGNNWDYRLMFLLLAIPQLLRWVRHPDRLISLISSLTLLGVYASLWYLFIERVLDYVPFGGYIAVVVDESFHWLVFCGLLYLLFFSMPEWMRERAKKWLSLSSDQTAVSESPTAW